MSDARPGPDRAAHIRAHGRLRAHAGALALALLAAGCGVTDDPSVTAPPSSTTAPAPSASPTASPDPTGPPASALGDETAEGDVPPWGATSDAEASGDARLTVTGLRTGTHEGYDRVVLDLGGTGTPGWHAEITAQAVEDPTGETVDLGGAAVLTLYLTGMGYPFETGQTELAADTVVPGGTVVTNAAFTGTFEGQSQVFLGLAATDAPYRVLLLRDPLRLVVDVQRSMG